MEKKKVIVYVDGYNFYYGLRNGGAKWKRLYWLDIVKFFERMMLPNQELVEVNYYSARPVHVFVPPTQKTYALADKCDHVVWLEHYRARFIQSMLPDEVTLANGYIAHRPANWC